VSAAARIRRIENAVMPDPTLGILTGTRPLASRMATLDVPGVSVAVIAEGAVAWTHGWGLRAASAADAITETTLFQAASISKPVTAVAVMRLVQEGRLDLDEDVNAYLRSWRVPANGTWQPRITVRQLLGHTAGTTVHSFAGYPHDHQRPSLRQVLNGERPASSAPVRVDTLPGLQFRYSSGGICIVQQVVMDVTGQPFPGLMRELVLRPLGMEHSTFEQPLPRSLRAGAAIGHRYRGAQVETGWHVYPEMAAAGLWTTPADLALLALELQQVQAGRTGRVLSKESVEAMLTPQARGPMGIGFRVVGQGDRWRFSHGGGNAGYGSRLLAYVEQGIGAVVMTNADMGSVLVGEVLRAIAREYNWPWRKEEETLEDEEEEDIDYLELSRPTARMDHGDWAGHVGEYVVGEDYLIRMSYDADFVLNAPGQPALVLTPTSNTVFYAEAIDLEVTFQRDAGGRTTGLVLRQSDLDVTARKVG